MKKMYIACIYKKRIKNICEQQSKMYPSDIGQADVPSQIEGGAA